MIYTHGYKFTVRCGFDEVAFDWKMCDLILMVLGNWE